MRRYIWIFFYVVLLLSCIITRTLQYLSEVLYDTASIYADILEVPLILETCYVVHVTLFRYILRCIQHVTFCL